MLRETPEKYHKILIPDFRQFPTMFAVTLLTFLCILALGCRRIVHDSGYLKVLHRPNVDLRRTAVAEIFSEGVITTDGL